MQFNITGIDTNDNDALNTIITGIMGIYPNYQGFSFNVVDAMTIDIFISL